MPDPIVQFLMEVIKVTLCCRLPCDEDCDETWDITHVKSVSWHDTSPWVLLEIPPETIVYQHIKPVRIEINMKCLDVVSLMGALEGVGAVDFETNRKTKFDHMIVEARLSDGNIVEYKFSDVRLDTLGISGLESDGEETPYDVKFYADNVVKL